MYEDLNKEENCPVSFIPKLTGEQGSVPETKASMQQGAMCPDASQIWQGMGYGQMPGQTMPPMVMVDHRAIQAAAESMAYVTGTARQVYDDASKILRSEAKKTAKRKTGARLWIKGDSLICGIMHDDGTETGHLLTSQLHADICVVKWCFPPSLKVKPIYWFRFEKDGVDIRLTEGFKPDEIIRQVKSWGIFFNEKLQKTDISEALNELFLQKAVYAESIAFPCRPGWKDQEFMYASKLLMWQGIIPVDKLPVSKVQLNETILDNEKDLPYIQRQIAVFRDPEKAVFLMMLPFVTITAGIDPIRMRARKYINLVSDRKYYDTIMYFVSIFNRGSHVEKIDSGKALMERLQRSGCDVLVFDGNNGSESSYMRGRKNDLFLILKEICTHKRNLPDELEGGWTSLLCIVSDGVSDDEDAVNVVLDEAVFNSMWSEYLFGRDLFQALFYEFIRYAEDHYDDVVKIVSGYCEGAADKGGFGIMFESTWLIFKRFLAYKGIGVADLFGISENYDIRGLLERVSISVDDNIGEELLCRIRNKVPEAVRFLKKGDGLGENGSDYIAWYDDQYYWFMPEFIENIFKEAHMSDMKRAALSSLKKDGLLETDKKGYKKTLQEDGRRFETYKFKRQAFDQVGNADLFLCGKGGE